MALNEVHYCFGIGYRCTTDKFMEGINARKYSSPFSWMVCDLQTSINFIETEFKDFLIVTKFPRNKQNFKWNNKMWSNSVLFFNSFFFTKE